MSKSIILHLNAYYIDNHLYAQLYEKLDAFLNQRVYIPIKLDREPENSVELPNTELIFDKCIKPSFKYNYFGKINYLFKSLISKKLHKDVNFIHAHNLFTDGAIAYKINQLYKIPYIVALRSTDINVQYFLMLHRRPQANKILINAKHIVFISPRYKDKFFSMLPKKIAIEIEDKTHIIPNGIHHTWLDNSFLERNTSSTNKTNLIYVGQIIKRKNINSLILAVDLLNRNQTETSYKLIIVGGENQYELDYYQEFLALTKEYKWIDYRGKVYDKGLLLQIFREASIFTMPSFGELFGLTYIEALSQGLPIIYSKNEGVDGFFKEESVGIAVDPNNIEDIAKGIEIVSNKEFINLPDKAKPFNWDKIAQQYINFYTK